MLTALAPVLAFAANVIVQVASYRFVFRHASRPNLLMSLFAGYCTGLSIMAAVSVLEYTSQSAQPVETASRFILNLLTYTALQYGYFHFINLGVTARRIRLLLELIDSESGLSYEEILRRYNAREMVDNRLGRLTGRGQVVLREGRYFIGKPVMLLMAKTIVAMKLIVLGKRSEFD
jgi:hypothetical protein